MSAPPSMPQIARMMSFNGKYPKPESVYRLVWVASAGYWGAGGLAVYLVAVHGSPNHWGASLLAALLSWAGAGQLKDMHLNLLHAHQPLPADPGDDDWEKGNG